ncbi:Protein transport protein sec73 [Leucoagaricus sp. SymC.cos]|nr:Protein transport protein sec73 [Leucoagaricus sp. SymC.cos]
MLAQASLGLGLSKHVLPHAPTSTPSPGNEINTVAFVSTSAPTLPITESSLGVRRSKSSQRLGVPSNSTLSEREASGSSERRSRGVSLFGFTSPEIKENVKGKETVEEVPKTLARKSSFWNRVKVQTPASSKSRPATAHGDISRQPPSLGVNLSDLPTPPPPRQKLQARDPLSRSYSERPQSYYPSITPDVSVSPAPNPPSSSVPRPSTAGSSPSSAMEYQQPIARPRSGSTRAPTLSFTDSSTAKRAPVPRLRSQTNPPLLHRLSLNVFSPSTFLSSPTSAPTSPAFSATSEPVRKPLIILRPMENEESPDTYVCRLMDAVSKVEVTSILASSAEPFYSTALKTFIRRFDFVGDPLDIALRKLLLDIGLPKETQQIDRVMEAFSQRYIQCNPELYVSEDHPYILAFSLIMLHTDAFNKSNRHKMTKPNYIKNTSLSGVSPEILEYFYDNIIFAPFIFIEDPLDFNGQRGLEPDSNRRSTVFRDVPSLNSGLVSTGSTLAMKTNKIDPYYMIINDLLGPQRIDVEAYVPLLDPFNFAGTLGKWDEKELLLSFANAHVVEVGGDLARSSPFFGLATGGSSSPLIYTNPVVNAPSQEVLTLRVTKVGLMNRKDELSEGGKKPLSRKWKSWGVLLTGSQLLFSRDPAWMQKLIEQAEKGSDEQVLMPPSAILRVDELLSVRNAVAVYDKSYSKRRFTFRLVLSDGRHLLLKASSETEMNQWILRINYASAFKTAGVRMRLLGLSGRSMQIAGVAAATSHLHDLQNQIYSSSRDSAKWDDTAPQQLFEMLSGDAPVNKRLPNQRKVTLKTNLEEVELETPMPLGVERTAEFKDAFDQVKADLAAENWTQMGQAPDSALSSLEVLSQASSSNDHPRLPSRPQIIKSKIAGLDDRLIAAESHLETHMRFIHNVATLTPFQKATRERLIIAIQTRARTVMQLRLEIARMRCHRKILCDDVLAESRIWKEVKDIALKTAKETLQSHQSPETPPLALSMRESLFDSPSKQRLQRCQKSESSLCESFHTAIDFGPDWPSSDDLGFLAASRVFDSPRPSTSGSFSSYPYDGNSSRIWKSEPASAAGSQADHDVTPKGEEADTKHEKFFTAPESPVEEAEAWDKTRCAKRVSLVRVPSTLDLLPVSKRLTLTLSTTAEPKS